MSLSRQNAELSQAIDVSSSVTQNTLFIPQPNVVNISGTLTADTGVFEVVGFDTGVEPSLLKGQISWNDTEGTVNIGLTDTVDIHIGEHSFFRVRNETGGVLYKGQVVYASGVHANGIILPDLYVADGSIREVRFMGFVLENLTNNSNGYVIQFGHIKEIDTRGNVASNIAVGDETWSAGDILYVHPTVPGKLTNVEPKHSIISAIILDAANNGSIFVRPTSYGHLSDNHDVNVSGLADNNLLVWNNSSNYWEPSTNLTFNGSGLQVDDGHIIIDNINTSDPYIKLTGGNTTTFHTGSALIAWDVSSSLVPKRLNFIIDGTIDSFPILQITSENKVGINKNDAAYELDVVGSGHFTGDLYVDQNVGIGTNTPSTQLDVSGSGNFSGDVTIDGHLSASTKSFLIDHPTKKGKKLQYGSLESPYHGVRLTGKDKLQQGICTVKLPCYLKKLVKEDEINIQITNYKHGKTIYVDEINIAKNFFVVRADRCKSLGDLEFFWSFTAVRKDVPELLVEKET